MYIFIKGSLTHITKCVKLNPADGLARVREDDGRGLWRHVCGHREVVWISPLECGNCNNNTAQLIHVVTHPHPTPKNTNFIFIYEFKVTNAAFLASVQQRIYIYCTLDRSA